jgi:hypothetical protein
VSRTGLLTDDKITKLAFARCFVYPFIFVLPLCLYINYPPNGDLYAHVQIVEQLDEGHLISPHFLYHLAVYGISKISHISFFHGSCLVMATCVAITMVLVEKILCFFLKDRYSDYFLLFVSLALMLVSSIYFPWKNVFPYKGIWSPNPWHNPTFIAARPFVLLIFYWYSSEIANETYFEKRFSLMRISILLVACALIKPNFVLAFIPGSMVFCAFFSNRKITMLINTGILLLPVLGILMFQFLFTYCSNISGDSSIQFCFFDVWHVHAQSVPLAIIQGAAFPMLISAMMFSSLRKDKLLVFSWILFIIGLLIFGLLCETGYRRNHGNFGWTYMFCLNILFLYSTIAFLRWIADIHKKTRAFKIVLYICFLVFLLHLFSGIYYVKYLLSGHIY